jgi:uncharacterized membrane protein YphA (DoxX/SURF4 family)
MASSKTSDGLTSLMLFLARLALGAWLLLAGYGVFDGVGGAEYLKLHLVHARDVLPESMARYYLTALPYVEILTGLLLILGLLTRVAGLLAAIVLASLLLGLTGSALTLDLGAASPFAPELVMLTLGLVLVATGGGNLGIDKRFGGGGKTKAAAAE